MEEQQQLAAVSRNDALMALYQKKGELQLRYRNIVFAFAVYVLSTAIALCLVIWEHPWVGGLFAIIGTLQWIIIYSKNQV